MRYSLSFAGAPGVGVPGAAVLAGVFWAACCFSVGWHHAGGGGQFLFFENFLLVLARFLFWGWDWAPGYNSMGFSGLDIS